MSSSDAIREFVQGFLDNTIKDRNDIWTGIYRLLLDYEHGVPRITDSNRLGKGIWRERALQVEQILARTLACETSEVEPQLDCLMRQMYNSGIQRMNPVGIAYAITIMYLIERFCPQKYRLKREVRIGNGVFANLLNSRRKSVDIVVWPEQTTPDNDPVAVISSKWGMRHDRIRDPQEEADTYKQQVPNLKFYLVTNEFDSARLQQVINYPTIDGVFHINNELVFGAYGSAKNQIPGLKNLNDLIDLFNN